MGSLENGALLKCRHQRANRWIECHERQQRTAAVCWPVYYNILFAKRLFFNCVCLSVNLETTYQIFMKFYGMVGHNPG